MTLNGVSIGKLIGDFSMKTCIEFIDVRVLDNNDHRKLGSRATYFRMMLFLNVWYRAAMV